MGILFCINLVLPPRFLTTCRDTNSLPNEGIFTFLANAFNTNCYGWNYINPH
jgi:hypothetical protein